MRELVGKLEAVISIGVAGVISFHVIVSDFKSSGHCFVWIGLRIDSGAAYCILSRRSGSTIGAEFGPHFFIKLKRAESDFFVIIAIIRRHTCSSM